MTAVGLTQASYRTRHEADHSLPFCVEVKNGGAIIPPYVAMAWCLIT
jgi:hypothetical protein